MEWTKINLPVFIKDYLPIILSVIALFAVFWEKIYPRVNLFSSINKVGVLRMQQGNRGPLLRKMLSDDLMSKSKSQLAAKIIEENPYLQSFIDIQDDVGLMNQVDSIINKIGGIKYNPPPDIAQKYLDEPLFVFPLYIPLVINNSGNRTAYISTIVLKIWQKKNPDNIWLYWAITELEEDKLIHRHEKYTDADRLESSFVMICISPSTKIEKNLFFVPIMTVNKQKIWRNNVKPGKYQCKILAYSPDGTKLLETDTVDFDLTDKYVFDSLIGSDSINDIKADEHFAKALNEK